METKGLFSGTIPLLSKSLDLRSARHNLIASNIANMETPGFKSFDMMVEEELIKSREPGGDMPIRRSDPGHMGRSGRYPEGAPALVRDKGSAFQSADGNTVDIDTSMSRLTENSIKYNATAQIMSKKLQGLKNVIQGGGQ